MEERMRTELEAAAFRRLVEHLRERNDVQNIDLMELAGFCRNCLSNWYQEAAAANGHSISKEEAREIIYGLVVTSQAIPSPGYSSKRRSSLRTNGSGVSSR